jgi:hypothetical protein
MKKHPPVALAVTLLAACGGGSELADPPTAGVGPAPAPPTAAEVSELEAVSTTVPAPELTEIVEGLVYHPAGEPFAAKSGTVDVIAPAGEGPFSTVVAFHGDPRSVSKEWHLPDARLIAEQGRVVFLPAWGHMDPIAIHNMDTQTVWDLNVRELKCAVAFAKARTVEFGGDPDHITLYGLSAGGNAVLMAGLADAEPLDTCAVDGPSVSVQALVPIDADWLLGGGWDRELSENPETFYSMTPWRFLDGSQDLPIHVMVTEIVGPFKRRAEPEAAASWLSYRHTDIDLVADLTERGFLADGELSLRESGEYGHQILTEVGYESSYTVMPGARHESWGEEGMAVVVKTVLNTT